MFEVHHLVELIHDLISGVAQQLLLLERARVVPTQRIRVRRDRPGLFTRHIELTSSDSDVVIDADSRGR